MPVTELYTSDPPAIPNGIDLRVYSNPICPYAQVRICSLVMFRICISCMQRADLILKVKKIPHEIVHIHLVRKPEWYLKLNPRGQVPFIDHKGQLLPESALIFGE